MKEKGLICRGERCISPYLILTRSGLPCQTGLHPEFFSAYARISSILLLSSSLKEVFLIIPILSRI